MTGGFNSQTQQLVKSSSYQTNHGVDSDGTKAERPNVVPFSSSKKGIKIRDTDWTTFFLIGCFTFGTPQEDW